MAQWLPISPNRNADGSFAALSQLPNASALRPVELQPEDDSFGTWREEGTQLEFSVAAQLGLTGVANASTSFQSKTFTYDAAMYAESRIVNPAIGGVIFATRWGAGLRAHVYVTESTTKMDLSLGNIAAAASAGLVSASYRVEAFGVMDATILKYMPAPGRFDQGTYKQIQSFIQAVRNENLIPRNKLTSVPFMVAVDNPARTFADPIERARTALFAIRRISKGMSRVDALTQARAAGVDPLYVETLYRTWAATTDQQAIPSAAAQSKAKVWLDRINLS